jgi:hypothetical protein
MMNEYPDEAATQRWRLRPDESPAETNTPPPQPGSYNDPATSYYAPPQPGSLPPAQAEYLPTSQANDQAGHSALAKPANNTVPEGEQPTLPMTAPSTAPYSLSLPPPAPASPPAPAGAAQSASGSDSEPAPSEIGAGPVPSAGLSASQFWRTLSLSGQITGIAGILLLIFFFLPWFYTPDFTAAPAGSRDAIPTVSHSGWHAAGGVKVFSILPALNLFPHLWCVLLGALALIAIAILLGFQRLRPRPAALLITLISLISLLIEFFFLLQVNAIEGAVQSRLNNAVNQSLYGTSWGFWLAVIVTIAELGVGFYLLLEAYTPETISEPGAPDGAGGPNRPAPTM